MTTGTKTKKEKLYHGVKMMKGFYYLGERLIAGGGSKAAVMVRTRIGWVKSKECSKVFYGIHFSLWLKRKDYQSCMQSTMQYASETYCLNDKEVAILTANGSEWQRRFSNCPSKLTTVIKRKNKTLK